MRKLLLTTILVSALGAGAGLAQTTETGRPGAPTTVPELVVPDGYMRQDTRLTAEDLLGATVYDARGESIGDVHDLVFDATDTAPGASGTSGATSPTTPPQSGAAAPATTPPAAGTSASDSAAGAEGTTSGGASTGGSATESTPPTSGTGAATGSATAPGTSGSTTPAPDAGSPAGSATAPADSSTTAPGTTAPAPDASVSAPSGTGSATPGSAGQSGLQTPGASGGQVGAMGDGTISHAVLDIGGFLGIGEHRVAVPVSDLAVYRSDSEVRIYLPWTREQLEAVPEYVEGDATTLGRRAMPAD